MASISFHGSPVTTIGELPVVGSPAPAFELVGADLGEVTSASLAGRRVVVSIFPSVDTGVCARSVREFNKRAAGLFIQNAFLQSAKRFCTELCFVSSERFDPVRINPDPLSDVRDRKHSIFLCYFDIRQHSVIIRANAGLCKSFGTL